MQVLAECTKENCNAIAIEVNHYTSQLMIDHRNSNPSLMEQTLLDTDRCSCGGEYTSCHTIYERLN